MDRWMIASELTNAVEKASADQPTPYAAINSAANQLLDDTGTRCAFTPDAASTSSACTLAGCVCMRVCVVRVILLLAAVRLSVSLLLALAGSLKVAHIVVLALVSKECARGTSQRHK